MEAHTYYGSIFSFTDHELYIVTSRAGERENGQIATWIMPATLVPDTPRLVAIMSPSNLTHDLIQQSGRFTVTMLAEGQEEYVPLFGLVSGRDIDKLDGIPLERTASGLPVPKGGCGWADCIIVESINAGDRIVYLADIVEQRIVTGLRPLRKSVAFSNLSPDIRTLLEAKQRQDGERDRAILRKFGREAQ